jgi:hypothetical protein
MATRKNTGKSVRRPTQGNNNRSGPNSPAPDFLNELFAKGGSVSFHTGEFTRKIAGIDTIIEEGFWDAEDGKGGRLSIPYKFTAIVGEPIPSTDCEPPATPRVRGGTIRKEA